MAYKDSVVINVVQWSKWKINLVLKLTLVVELRVLLSSHLPPLLKHWLQLVLAVHKAVRAAVA